jgi:hypothetical protein
MLASVLELPAEDWSAIGTCTTVAVAVAAGIIAFFQVREARRLREEQAQPYVVVYLGTSTGGDWVIDLVIKNLGTTAATDVKVAMDPPPQRAIDSNRDGDGDGLMIPESIPLLVPGQEWRTLWDTTLKRHDSGLPERYTTTVSFKDSRGRENFDFEFVLDWGTVLNRELVTTYGLHDAAKALREMNKTVKGWSEGSRGLKVYARDGDARDQREREYLEKRRREREAQPPPEGGETEPA